MTTPPKQRIKLTRKSIPALAAPSTGYVMHWDSELPNFGIRVTAGGARSYIVQRRIHGRDRRITIARYEHMAPEEAREEARGLLGDIARGKDPRAEKERKEAAETARAHTLSKLMQVYADYLKARGKIKTAKDVEYAVKAHIDRAHPRIAKLPAREVASRDVATVVRTVVENGKRRRAAMLRTYMMAAYNLAMRAETDSSAPSALIAYGVQASPVVGVATVQDSIKARNRTLTDDEFRHFLQTLAEQTGPAWDAISLALLGGGQRIQQVLRLAASDVYDDGFIRLIDSKGRRATPREHFVPLAPRGEELAKSLAKRARQSDAKFLFTFDGKTPMRLETVSAAVAGIAAKAPKGGQHSEPYQARDLRRSAETRLAALGISRELRGQLLSHGISGVQAKHYDRYDYAKEKRAALVAWEKHLADIAAGKFSSGKITPIRARGGKAA